MESQFSRTALLLGENAIELLWSKRVALFGAGGVGGFAAEALIRAGIGALDVFDNDAVNESNLNRQIIALHSTIGMSKVEAIKARLNDISPNAQIGAHQMFYLPENADQVDFARYDYIIDCIDTVKAKVDIAVRSAFRSSAQWGRATSSIRQNSRLPICMKRASVPSPA